MDRKSWRGENGHIIPLEQCTKEQLIDRFRHVVQTHDDQRTADKAAIEALQKRLKDHRKAKALANRRADIAVKAMRDLLDTFETGGKVDG